MVAATATVAAAADVPPPSEVAAVVAGAHPAAAATRDVPAATKGVSTDSATAAGDLPTAAKSSSSWCTSRISCVLWFYLGRTLYKECLPVPGSAHHTVAKELMYSVLVDIYYAMSPTQCCFDRASTDRIHEALMGVAPYISPTCSLYASRSASEGGREGGGRPTVGGDHPLDNVVRAVGLAAPRRSGTAAADSVVGDGQTTVRGAKDNNDDDNDDEDDDDNDDDDIDVVDAAPVEIGGAAAVARGNSTAASDAALAASDVAAAVDEASVHVMTAADDVERVVIYSGGSCCVDYEEYEPYHTHPCCHVGCRIAAEYLPFITHDECCNYQHQRPSTQEWYYTNREGRYC